MEKRGLTEQLRDAGLTASDVVAYGDEMRVGLRGQVRKRWGIQGIKVIQPLQLTYQWEYLSVFLEIVSGRIWWAWTPKMNEGQLLGVVRAVGEQTPIRGLVWDGAPSHRGDRMRALATEANVALVTLPAYSPELNPAERLFEELRAAVEGVVYPNLAAKVAAVEAELQKWDADPARVRRLVGWDSITHALDQIPAAS